MLGAHNTAIHGGSFYSAEFQVNFDDWKCLDRWAARLGHDDMMTSLKCQVSASNLDYRQLQKFPN